MALTRGEHPLSWSFMLVTAVSFPLAYRRARLSHLLVLCGNLAVRLKEWDKATALVKEAMRFKDDGELLFLLATSLYQSGQHDEAEKAYLAVLSREPQQVAGVFGETPAESPAQKGQNES